MTLCPFARWRPVGPHSTTPITSIGLVLHVNQGESDPWNTFEAGLANSHWQVNDGTDGPDGELVQYVDSDLDSWAQVDGNQSYHSMETGGFNTTPLTPKQVATAVRLYAWGHVVYGWPFQLAEAPGQPGFGWHGMGGVSWGNHPFCPGEPRKAQRAGILAAARALLEPKPPPPILEGEPMKWIIDPITKAQYLQSGFALQHLSPSQTGSGSFWTGQAQAEPVPDVSVIAKWPGYVPPTT